MTVIFSNQSISPAAFETTHLAAATPAFAFATTAVAHRRALPLSVPAEQAYYWSGAWQEGEREAIEALQYGDFEVFPENGDPLDIARWLFSEDG